MKARYIIYCALIALAVFSAPASADCNTVTVGDANSDGRITTADSMLALQMSVGSIPPDLESADINADGKVNSLDALMILTIAQKTQVYVNAPEVVSGAFNVTIDIYMGTSTAQQCRYLTGVSWMRIQSGYCLTFLMQIW
jgi:hypothetical protein